MAHVTQRKSNLRIWIQSVDWSNLVSTLVCIHTCAHTNIYTFNSKGHNWLLIFIAELSFLLFGSYIWDNTVIVCIETTDDIGHCIVYFFSHACDWHTSLNTALPLKSSVKIINFNRPTCACCSYVPVNKSSYYHILWTL